MSSGFLKSQILMALPAQALLPPPFYRSESVTATAHKPSHQRSALLTGSQKHTCLGHGIRSSQGEVIDLCLQGPAVLGTGRGQGFPDVPLKGWTSAREPSGSTKEACSPSVHQAKSTLSEESALKVGWAFRNTSMVAVFHWPLSLHGHDHQLCYTHLSPTTSSGFYSNKAKANRV